MSRHPPDDVLQLRVSVEFRGKSPRELRRDFIAAIREEIFDAAATRGLDLAVADELYRALPEELG